MPRWMQRKQGMLRCLWEEFSSFIVRSRKAAIGCGPALCCTPGKYRSTPNLHASDVPRFHDFTYTVPTYLGRLGVYSVRGLFGVSATP